LKNKSLITGFILILFCLRGNAQNSTFSPYSRYGIGELAPSTFAHNSGMGNAYIALRPDSTMPVFINAGNPASYSLIRLTSLEVGGKYLYSQFYGSGKSIRKWSTNFAYGALGFPIAGNGGACIGIMPYSSTGYDTEGHYNDPVIGDITNKYSGSGGLNKAFGGYGVMPFHRRLTKFRRRNLFVPDSVKRLSPSMFKTANVLNKLLSDFSIGFNVNYIFGNTLNTTKIIYPGSLLYNNTYRERDLTVGDFTGNFGIQTSVTFDSARTNNNKRRAMNEKVRLTFGYFMNLNSTLKANYNSVGYNYILNGAGEEIIRDTVYYNVDQKTTVTLPLETGFGIGLKKGERINAVMDVAVTNWESFRYLNQPTDLQNNLRVAAGIHFVPEKYAAGRAAFFKRIHYRFGISHETGYIKINNLYVTNSFISAGVGLPVGIGRLSSMINVSAQYGQMGTTAKDLIQENYWKINFGFTFSDRWFQKFRYD
jgi:hypothetical protein